MEKIEGKTFEGERALFGKSDLIVRGCTFQNGESPLKEGKRVSVSGSTFRWKYPLWYGREVKIEGCTFQKEARAGIWYTEKARVSSTVFLSPKMFRRCRFLDLTDVRFEDGEETLWACENVKVARVSSKGDYFGMNSKNLLVKDLKLEGNYPFDGCENIEIHDSVLYSKDALWNCRGVKVFHSTIVGEYLGWNSSDVTFVDCRLESLQGFCYMKNVTLVRCTLPNTTLSFEYSTVDADVDSTIESVKNPCGGRIASKGIQTLILEPDKVDPSNTVFLVKKGEGDA